MIDDRLTIACGEGALRPTLVKRAGKRAMSAEEMLRGFAVPKGTAALVTRFKFTLEYDGSAFVGWQRQDNGMSVQQALEEAVFKTCAETVTAHAAGRTDAGVHATGQVAHVDVEKEFTPDKLQAALNFHLKPWPVSIIRSELAPPDFHARFSATRPRATSTASSTAARRWRWRRDAPGW